MNLSEMIDTLDPGDIAVLRKMFSSSEKVRDPCDRTFCHMTYKGERFRFTGKATRKHAYIELEGGRTMFVAKPDPTAVRTYSGWAGRGWKNTYDGFCFASVGGAFLFCDL